MTSMARGMHGPRRRQAQHGSLLDIDDASATSSTIAGDDTGDSNGGSARGHLTRSLTRHASPGFLRYAAPARACVPHRRRRRRPALIKPAAHNTLSEKLLKCRRMFSALHITCTPADAAATKRDTKLRRQHLRKQRRIEQRRLVRVLYSGRQQSKRPPASSSPSSAQARPVESGASAGQLPAGARPQLHVTTSASLPTNWLDASSPIGIPRTGARPAADHPHGPTPIAAAAAAASIASQAALSPAAVHRTEANTGPLSGLSASPLDVLLMAAAIQDAQSGDDLDAATADAPASVGSSSDVEVEADDGLLGMEMEMETETPEMKAAAS
ncbi:hypothetical protein SYNPS1DRAFT_25515, partial [Syncephalis pseudoplumigaleata]